MQLSEIRTSDEHQSAMQKISDLMDLDPPPGSSEFELLEVFSALAEEYEIKLFPIEEPDPVEALKFRMDQMKS